MNVNNEAATATSASAISAARSYNDLDQIHQQQHQQQQQYQRPVPDYETAIRNKYGALAPTILQQQQQQQQQLSQQQLYNSQPSLVTDAQPPQVMAAREVEEGLYQNNHSLGINENGQVTQHAHIRSTGLATQIDTLSIF